MRFGTVNSEKFVRVLFFAKLPIWEISLKQKPSEMTYITLSFTDVGKSCSSHELLT